MTYELALMEREELGEEKATLANLRSVMNSLKISAEKAVEILKISKDEQPRYLSKLKA